MPTVNGSFVFTDIVGSSRLWNKYNKKTKTAIDKHEKIIYTLVKKFNGMVVKTIGDAFMLFFKGKNGYKKAISCCLELQESLITKPIYLSSLKRDTIRIRIGICQGPAEVHTVFYQNKKLKDFLGTTINLASRMESKVSKKNGIAVCFYKTPIPIDFMIRAAHKFPNNDLSVNDYTRGCKIRKFKRSGRLISVRCFNSSLLHGVPGIKAFTFNPYNTHQKIHKKIKRRLSKLSRKSKRRLFRSKKRSKKRSKRRFKLF
jgi:hypothetical protein